MPAYRFPRLSLARRRAAQRSAQRFSSGPTVLTPTSFLAPSVRDEERAIELAQERRANRWMLSEK